MLKIIKNDRFYSDSLIFFLASLLGGFGNYVFHALSARLLLPSGYGELQSLISLSVIFSIPVGVLSLVIIKYVAEFKAKNENLKIFWLFKSFTKKLLLIGIILFLGLLLFSPLILNFLSLNSPISLIILIASSIFIFLAALNNSLLQGLQKFKALSAISIIAVIFKIVLAFVLIKLSLAVSGALGAIVLAGLLAYGLTFIPLKSLTSTKFLKSPISQTSPISLPLGQMFCFSSPVFFTILFTTLLYNLDILLVKHFFDSATAGQYAALALLGHIIFFLIGPLITVMFPSAAQAHASSATAGSRLLCGAKMQTPNSPNLPNNPNSILKKTLLMSFFVGTVALIFYFTFPSLIIKIIVGAQYLALAPHLGWFGITMFLFSLISLFSQYFLSIGKTRFTYILFASVFSQVILISIWHASLWQIVWIMNGVMAVSLVNLLLYHKFSLKH